MEKLADATPKGLEEEQRRQIHNLLHEARHVFTNDIGPLGITNRALHEIKTGQHPPIKQAPRRIPIHLRGQVDDMVADMKRIFTDRPGQEEIRKFVIMCGLPKTERSD